MLQITHTYTTLFRTVSGVLLVTIDVLSGAASAQSDQLAKSKTG